MTRAQRLRALIPKIFRAYALATPRSKEEEAAGRLLAAFGIRPFVGQYGPLT